MKMVRAERLELSRLSTPEPKSGAYTNFATLAKARNYIKKKFYCVAFYQSFFE